MVRKTSGPHVFTKDENSPVGEIREFSSYKRCDTDATSTALQPRSRETAQPHSWSKKPGYATEQELEEVSTRCGKSLCICIITVSPVD